MLSDSEKRASYDRYGHDGLKNTGFSGFGGFEDIFSHFADVFGGDIFGGRQRSGPRRGRDLGMELGLTFDEQSLAALRQSKSPTTCNVRPVKELGQNRAVRRCRALNVTVAVKL